MAYDQQLGQALDFGQVGPPSNPKKATAPSFLDWQAQTYGNGQPQEQAKPVAPKTATTQVMTPPPPPEPTFMPNGQPVVSPVAAQLPQPVAPQTTTKTTTTTPAPPPTLGKGLPTQYAGLEEQLAQILQSIAGQGSLNPTVVSQLKGKQKDAATLMGKQNQGALRQALAGRGIDVNSNYGQSRLAGQQNTDTTNLLDQYRAIDTGAATQNRADILQSLGPLQSAIYGAYGQQNWLDNMALQYQMLNNQQLSGLFQ